MLLFFGFNLLRGIIFLMTLNKKRKMWYDCNGDQSNRWNKVKNYGSLYDLHQ